MARLRLEVVILDSRTVLDLLEVDHVLLLLGLASHLGLLELEFPIVHDSDDGRPRHRRDFNEIEALLLCGCQRRVQIQNSQLTPVGRNDAQRTDTNLAIDADALRVVLNKPCSSREIAVASLRPKKMRTPNWSPLGATSPVGVARFENSCSTPGPRPVEARG